MYRYVKIEDVESVLSEYLVRSYVQEGVERLNKCALEVSEDAVSKHDLWRIVEDNAYWVTYNETSKEKGMTLTGINQALNECPPVVPCRAEGWWFIREYEHFTCDQYFTCDQCGEDVESYAESTQEARNMLENGDYPNYCPNCGAKMKG